MLLMFLACKRVSAQESRKAATEQQSSAAHGMALAEKGRCAAALPLLKNETPHIADRETKRRAGLAIVRCAMKLDQADTAVAALEMLNRDFPKDPDVLYVTTHAYSDLATRASQKLATTAPNSHQARELYAESLEMQGKWSEAADEYRKILAEHADLPGIHYRLGRLMLSEPPTATTPQDATQEFQAELKLDPNNADAEYILGELARQSENWDGAVSHLSQATKLDPGLTIAYLGLGMSLNSTGRFADSIAPLEKYVKMQPNDPAGHYQLAIACARSGRKEEAEKQMALQRELVNKARESQAQKEVGAPQPQK
jgi:tetratricopeptide (TPR) repeat protein